MKLKCSQSNQSLMNQLVFCLLIITVFCWCLSHHTSSAHTKNREELVACSNGTNFASARTFQLGRNPEDVSAGDFNGDGLLDLAVSNSGLAVSGGQVSIYAGNGRGEFANVYNILLTTLPGRLVQGDFNNDGKLDLATLTFVDGGGVVIALGRGDWTFATTLLPINFIKYRAGLVAADFNTDGKTDLAFSGEGKLIVLTGDGKGAFIRSGSYSSNTPPGALATADFNGDSKPDVLVSGEETGQKPVLFINDGTGHFHSAITLTIGEGPFTVGDLNRDGKTDLAFVRLTAQQERGVTVALGTGAGSFGEPLQFPLGAYGYPRSLLINDVNGDGKLDLLATEADGNRVTVLLGNGLGVFSVRASYNTGYFPITSAVGDFDRDGKADLVTINSDLTFSVLTGLGDGQFLAPRAFDQADQLLRATTLADVNGDSRLDALIALGGGQGGVLVAYGDGMGGFGAPKIYQTDRDNNDLAVADFNKDGRPDIVVVGGSLQSTGSVRLLLGMAAGDFSLSPRDLNSGQTPSTVLAPDLNSDGNADLVVGNYGSNDVAILLGDGRGNFAAPVKIPVGLSPSSIVPGDFNKDGKLDLVIANYGGTHLTVLRGNGAGGFSASSITVAAVPLALAAADFNNDGNLDLAVIHRDESTTQNLSILLGTGDGGFRTPIRYTTEKFPLSVAVGDFTGDGKLDLALTEVLLLKNTSATDHVSIYAGNGTGNFARVVNVPVPVTVSLTAGDLNRDGMMDLAVMTRTGISAALTICNPPAVNTLVSVSAASYLPVALAPNSIAAGFGARLATASRSAIALPLPTELVGTRVSIKDVMGFERAAPLFFVSPAQINYLVPVGTAAGLATISVTSGDGQITTGVIWITPTLPSLFTANANGSGPPAGYLLRVKSNGMQSAEPLATLDPTLNRYVPLPIDFFSNSAAQPDQIYLVLFGTGIRNRGSLANVEVLMNGYKAEVLYAGSQGSLAGLDQINAKLIQFSNTPLVDVVITVDGKPSNKIQIAFK